MAFDRSISSMQDDQMNVKHDLLDVAENLVDEGNYRSGITLSEEVGTYCRAYL